MYWFISLFIHFKNPPWVWCLLCQSADTDRPRCSGASQGLHSIPRGTDLWLRGGRQAWPGFTENQCWVQRDAQRAGLDEETVLAKVSQERGHYTWAPSSPTLHRDKHSESISCRESSVTSKSPSVSPGPPVRSNTRNDHCWRASSRLSGSSGHLGRQVTLQKLVDVRSFEEGWGTLPGTSSGQKGRGRKRNRHLKQRQLWRRMTKLWVWVPPCYWRELEKSVFLTFGYLFWKMKIRISNLSSSQWWFLDEMYKMFCKPDRLPQWNNALLLSFLLLYQYHY